MKLTYNLIPTQKTHLPTFMCNLSLFQTFKWFVLSSIPSRTHNRSNVPEYKHNKASQTTPQFIYDNFREIDSFKM